MAVDKGINGAPKRPLVYCFQHVALPEAVFENHPELIQELFGEGKCCDDHLLHFWSKSDFICMKSGWLLEYENEEDEERADNEEMEWREKVKLNFVNKQGFSFFIYEMPEPKFPTEAYCVAICYKDDEEKEYMQPSIGSRYFVLEKDGHKEKAFVCEWTREHEHINYGEMDFPSIETFSEIVMKKVLLQENSVSDDNFTG